MGVGVGVIGRAETCESVQTPRPEFETQGPGLVSGLRVDHCHSEPGPSLHSAEAWRVCGQRTL